MVVGILLRGRRMAEREMVDTCVVRRPTITTTDPATFEDVATFTTVYEGVFKVQSHEAFEQDRESAGGTVRISRIRCDFPAGSALFQPGDVVTILTAQDPLMVGRHLRLATAAPYKTHATAYRIPAEELSGVEVPAWEA